MDNDIEYLKILRAADILNNLEFTTRIKLILLCTFICGLATGLSISWVL